MLIFPKSYASLQRLFFFFFFSSEADLITWKMKQGLMIQSLQPIASPHKNELPHDTKLLFGLQKKVK